MSTEEKECDPLDLTEEVGNLVIEIRKQSYDREKLAALHGHLKEIADCNQLIGYVKLGIRNAEFNHTKEVIVNMPLKIYRRILETVADELMEKNAILEALVTRS